MSAVGNLFQSNAGKFVQDMKIPEGLEQKKKDREDAERLEKEAADRTKLEEENRLKAEGEAKAALESKTERRKRSSSIFARSSFDQSATVAPAPGKKTLLGY
jgi:hypothetical protein